MSSGFWWLCVAAGVVYLTVAAVLSGVWPMPNPTDNERTET
jgi:hypothetical protein